MSDDLITFVIDGAAERRGAIPAEAFVAKLREFVALINSFDRAFAQRQKRSISLELVDLKKSSPARAAFRGRASAPGVDPGAIFAWTADQLAKIYHNEPIDDSIEESQLDALISLAHMKDERIKSVSLLQIEYRGRPVAFDETMKARATELRHALKTTVKPPWRSGVSKGTLFGELRSVSDIEGERTFVICPPTGSGSVTCVFPENLREAMNTHLFQAVRVQGFLHYGGESPFPVLVEAEAIAGVLDETHFSEMEGIFRDREIDQDGGVFWPMS
jgi:hypothetical protein